MNFSLLVLLGLASRVYAIGWDTAYPCTYKNVKCNNKNSPLDHCNILCRSQFSQDDQEIICEKACNAYLNLNASDLEVCNDRQYPSIGYNGSYDKYNFPCVAARAFADSFAYYQANQWARDTDPRKDTKNAWIDKLRDVTSPHCQFLFDGEGAMLRNACNIGSNRSIHAVKKAVTAKSGWFVGACSPYEGDYHGFYGCMFAHTLARAIMLGTDVMMSRGVSANQTPEAFQDASCKLATKYKMTQGSTSLPDEFFVDLAQHMRVYAEYDVQKVVQFFKPNKYSGVTDGLSATKLLANYMKKLQSGQTKSKHGLATANLVKMGSPLERYAESISKWSGRQLMLATGILSESPGVYARARHLFEQETLSDVYHATKFFDCKNENFCGFSSPTSEYDYSGSTYNWRVLQFARYIMGRSLISQGSEGVFRVANLVYKMSAIIKTAYSPDLQANNCVKGVRPTEFTSFKASLYVDGVFAEDESNTLHNGFVVDGALTALSFRVVKDLFELQKGLDNNVWGSADIVCFQTKKSDTETCPAGLGITACQERGAVFNGDGKGGTVVGFASSNDATKC